MENSIYLRKLCLRIAAINELLGKGGVIMKTCPFCKTEWEGTGPCPGCGVDPEKQQDDSLFRPPENDAVVPAETPPDFQVEELLRWESSPESETPGEEVPKKEEEPSLPERAEEGALHPRKCFKRWQKLTAAVVAVVIVVTAVAVTLWPKPQVLPQEPAFFVQGDTLMALPAVGEPKTITPYIDEMEYNLWTSPDQKSFAWMDKQESLLKLMPPEGETVSLQELPCGYSNFSKDGKYFYYSCYETGEKDAVLYQYDIASSKKQKVGLVHGYSPCFWENGSLLVTQSSSTMGIYDANTLEQKWLKDFYASAVMLSGNTVYYVDQTENGYRLCQWQDGKVEVLLENLVSYAKMVDGSLYLVCWTGQEVPISDLLENDMGADGEKVMQMVEGRTMRVPDASLYHLNDKGLQFMGENLGVYPFGGEIDSTLIKKLEYQPLEETTFSLSEIMGLYEGSSGIQLQNIIVYITSTWPKESSADYVAVNDKKLRLPENKPEQPYILKVEGDWVCIYNLSNEASACGLWLGHIEGEEIVYHDFYMTPNLISSFMGFTVTPDGRLYYWGDADGMSIGPIYENGVPIVTDADLQSVQFTDDGAVYFLNGSSSSWTLNRIADGKMEAIAQNIKDFIPCTRDYALCLQNREDKGYDLLACNGGNQTTVVAEQVELLLRPMQNQMYTLASTYANGVGGVDGSEVTTEIVD